MNELEGLGCKVHSPFAAISSQEKVGGNASGVRARMPVEKVEPTLLR